MKNGLFTFIAFLLLSHLGYAKTYVPKKNLLISIGDLKTNNNDKWKKDICDQLFNISNQVISSGINITCRSFDTTNFKDEFLSSEINKYDYHMRVIKDYSSTISVDVTKLKRIHESDFKTLGWSFKDGENTKITKEDAMAKAITNFLFYIEHETAFKAGLLANGANESGYIVFDQVNGVFRDKLSNEAISINKAYSLFETESERKKNYLRTGVEIGVLLSAAMGIYYENVVYNQVDFDYGFREGIKKKFNGEAILFDDNDKRSNYGHVYAGVLYYQNARSNGFNSLESFLVSFASSTIWEFMEYHEVLSINDEILTPIGGYVIGEASYQISCALFQKNNTAANILGYAINPGMGTNHAVDKFYNKKNKYASQPDCKNPRWSDISFYLGLEKDQKAYNPSEHNTNLIGMEATVINIDNYASPGKSSNLVYDTAMANALVELNGNQGLIDLRVIAQTITAAYHQKNLYLNQKGQLQGYNLILGIGSSSTWNDRGAAEHTPDEDFYGTIGIIGATAHADIFYNGFNIKAEMSFYGDFAMVKSYSLTKYQTENPTGLTGLSSTLTDKGYYWGAGTSTLAALSIQYQNWEVGYRGQYSYAQSISGRHTHEEEITNHDQFDDSLRSDRIYISYQLTKKLKIKLTREFNFRSGSIRNEFKTSGTENRIMGTLVYQF